MDKPYTEATERRVPNGAPGPAPEPASLLGMYKLLEFRYGVEATDRLYSHESPVKFNVPKKAISELIGHPVDERDPDSEFKGYFKSMEQFILYCKAARFHDTKTQAKIHDVSELSDLKNLDKQISGVNADSWDEIFYGVVVLGCLFKFRQNTMDKLRLLNTENRELVEAMNWDRFWGIGYSEEWALLYREDWDKNLLANALTEVRDTLRDEDEADEKKKGQADAWERMRNGNTLLPRGLRLLQPPNFPK